MTGQVFHIWFLCNFSKWRLLMAYMPTEYAFFLKLSVNNLENNVVGLVGQPQLYLDFKSSIGITENEKLSHTMHYICICRRNGTKKVNSNLKGVLFNLKGVLLYFLNLYRQYYWASESVEKYTLDKPYYPHTQSNSSIQPTTSSAHSLWYCPGRGRLTQKLQNGRVFVIKLG